MLLSIELQALDVNGIGFGGDRLETKIGYL